MESVEKLFADPVEEEGKTQERLALEENPYDMIRESIQFQVNEVMWMNEVNRRQADIPKGDSSSSVSSESNRCIVCTLPLGTCPHTVPWLKSKEHSALLSSVDSEIEQVLGVLDSSFKVDTAPQVEDIDLDSIKWAQHTPRMADKIGDTFLPLSLPPERGWHSMVQVGKFIVLFGGLRFKDSFAVPQPFTTVTRPDEVEYLADMYIYDTENLSWHIVTPEDERPGVVRSWPCRRYAHSATALDKYRMLLFGGRGEGGRYLSDTWIFSLVTYSWTAVSNPQRSDMLDMSVRPSPRAFSAMASSRSARCVVLYGGTNGEENFGDIWLFKWGGKSFEYEAEDGAVDTRPNTSSVCVVDGVDDPMTNGCLGPYVSDMYWSRGVTVGGGSPPAARYGHRLLAIPPRPGWERTSKNIFAHTTSGEPGTKLRDGTFLAVVGGCCVSPSRELEGRKNNAGSGVMPPNEINALLKLSHQLQDKYEAEGGLSAVAGQEIMSRLERIEAMCGVSHNGRSIGNALFDVKEVHRRAAAITARIAEMESETRTLESDLAETWFKAQASSMAIRNTSSHPSSAIGVHFLCVDDMAWVPQVHPKIRGDIPLSRMHFGSTVLGDYIFVFGGLKPTALSYKMVEDKYTTLYALDLNTLVWSQPNPMDRANYLDGPLRVAQADISRAQERVAVERNRGIAAGAREGVTAELVEAETILRVCRWRKTMLLKEQEELQDPPLAAWGYGVCMVAAAGNRDWLGSRALIHGGWNAYGGRGGVNFKPVAEGSFTRSRADNGTDCSIILDVEQELERRRRLEEEFHAKLERERREEESRAFQMEIQSLFELRMAQKEEKERQQKELEKMEIEDYLSSLPPLSKPKPVQLVKANEHTIWVKWGRSVTNSVGKMLRPGAVTYFLYMSGGFVLFNIGDRVEVTPQTDITREPSKETEPEEEDDIFGHKSGSESDEESDDEDISQGPLKKVVYIPKRLQCLPYKGEIIGAKKGTGCFTIRADDGRIEKNVHRSCLCLLREEEDSASDTDSPNSRKKLTKRQISYRKAREVTKSVKRATEQALASAPGNRLGPEWRLIYKGEDAEYAVQGIVPWDVLQSEPGITVTVKFCLRTIGVDFPEDEYSDVSDVSVFSTTWSNLEIQEEESVCDESTLQSPQSSSMRSYSTTSRLPANSKMSKSKKEIISAVLDGQRSVQLERWKDVVSSEGTFDTFL